MRDGMRMATPKWITDISAMEWLIRELHETDDALIIAPWLLQEGGTFAWVGRMDSWRHSVSLIKMFLRECLLSMTRRLDGSIVANLGQVINGCHGCLVLVDGHAQKKLVGRHVIWLTCQDQLCFRDSPTVVSTFYLPWSRHANNMPEGFARAFTHHHRACIVLPSWFHVRC